MEMKITGIGTFKDVEGGWIEMGDHIFSISNTEEEWGRISAAKKFFDRLENTIQTKALKKYTSIMIEAAEDERLCNSPFAEDYNQGWNLTDMVMEAEKLLKLMKKRPDDWYTSTARRVKRFVETYKPLTDGIKAKTKH